MINSCILEAFKSSSYVPSGNAAFKSFKLCVMDHHFLFGESMKVNLLDLISATSPFCLLLRIDLKWFSYVSIGITVGSLSCLVLSD